MRTDVVLSDQSSLRGLINEPPPPHPYLPFGHMCFLAPTGIGKSTLIVNMIMRRSYPYYAYYVKIRICTGRLRPPANNVWGYVVRSPESAYIEDANGDEKYLLYTEFNDQPFVDAKAYVQECLARGEEPLPQLIIYDDCAMLYGGKSGAFFSERISVMRQNDEEFSHLW
jgi:hypothetical protein